MKCRWCNFKRLVILVISVKLRADVPNTKQFNLQLSPFETSSVREIELLKNYRITFSHSIEFRMFTFIDVRCNRDLRM